MDSRATQPRNYIISKHIFLVGLMGAGKTSVGQHLATLLNRPFCDTDELIEQRECSSISEIFATRGEVAFRLAERDLIESFPQAPVSIVSCGGGLIIQPGLAELLKSKGIIIGLKASAQILAERLKDDKARPLLRDCVDRFEALNRLLEQRAPYYAIADYVVDTDELSASQVAHCIVERFLASSKAFSRCCGGRQGKP